MMIDKKVAQARMSSGKNLILITENFSGHRIQWLEVMMARLKRLNISLLVLSLQTDSSDLISTSNGSFQICDDFVSKKELAKFLKPYSSNNRCITWDGDNWLLAIIRYRIKCRILIMRPYLDYSSMYSFFATLLKIMICHGLIFSRKIEIAFLGIPMDKFALNLIHVVDDELDILLSQERILRIGKQKHSSEEWKVILPGFITKRKNPSLSILATEKARSSINGEVKLIFLGSLARDLSIEADFGNRSWLVIRNEYFSRIEFLTEIAEAHLVILPYSNRASSSIALEAMSLGTRVIMVKDHRWDNFRKRNPSLLHVTKLNLDSLSTAIGHALTLNIPYDATNEMRYRTRQLALNFLIEGRRG